MTKSWAIRTNQINQPSHEGSGFIMVASYQPDLLTCVFIIIILIVVIVLVGVVDVVGV